MNNEPAVVKVNGATIMQYGKDCKVYEAESGTVINVDENGNIEVVK